MELKLKFGESSDSDEEGKVKTEKQEKKQELDLNKATIAHIRGHSGEIDVVNVDEPQYFDHDGTTYMVKRPVMGADGRRMLVYDEGNPVPILHAGNNTDDADNLTEEVYVTSILDQLSNPSKSADMDILGKLSRIPPTFWIFVLAILVLWQSGTLGGLIPF